MSAEQVQTETNDGLAVRTDAPERRIFTHDGRRIDATTDRSKIIAHDFLNPGFQRQDELRKLEELYGKFIEQLTMRLSTFLRMECVVKLAEINSATFARFAETMKETTHVSLFQVEPLPGIGVLEMSLPVSLSIADRMLGGKGRIGDTTRSLTEIEVALLEDVMQLILTEWTRQFPERETAIAPAIIGHDSTGRFLQTSEPETVHIVMRADVTLGETTGRLQLGVPFETMEPILAQMDAAQVRAIEIKPKANVAWRTQFNGIHVPVVAEWIVRDMRVGDVIALKPGDVLEMNSEMIAQTHVRLANTSGFIGTAGVEDGHVAVQLTQRKATE
jgi:flagellar motor switch protein FliM